MFAGKGITEESGGHYARGDLYCTRILFENGQGGGRERAVEDKRGGK